MLQMSGAMNGMGGAAPGGFPAPGVPGGGASNAQSTPGAGTTPVGSPPPPLFNPWFPPPPPSGASNTGASAGAGATPGAGAPPPNPFASMFDPAAMQQMLGMLGGGPGVGGSGFGGFGAAPAAPADTRPPEERFQVQLQVSDYLCHFMQVIDIAILATARYGFHERATEYPRASCYWRQRTCCN